MTTLTITIPDHLAQQLEPHQDRMTEIIELGLRELVPASMYGDVIDFLASGPDPNAIAHLQAAPDLQARIADLLQKNQAGTITPTETAELERYEQLDHLMTLIKVRARHYLSKT